MAYDFDRYLRYDELTQWLHDLAAEAPELVTVASYGRSHEGRELWLVTVTDSSAGPAESKPAHWVDASIHAVELTATVAACHLVRSLVERFRTGDAVIVEALRTRTFYVAPRVNPDGAEWALAERPRYRRSSVRPWPWRDAHQWPGLVVEDIDGDGRILQMRIPDPDGAWMPHPDDPRLMVPVPAAGPPPGPVPGAPGGSASSTATSPVPGTGPGRAAGVPRYRLLAEGTVAGFDGFTVPTPPPPEGLDLNRNFPAGWGPKIPGSGDHPLSEPEIDALVRAIVARPNICGYHAFHTSGGVLLRPSSTEPDSKLPRDDVWVWQQLGERATELTGYPVHQAFEDFTWDPNQTMSGASDDWVYEHLGIFGWTTEFWDVVHAATGTKGSTLAWYLGPSDAEALAVLRWCDAEFPAGHVDWYPFDHPQLGRVELGGWDELSVWVNPPPHRLRAEVAPHVDAVVHQAMCAPCLRIRHTAVVPLGGDTWRVEIGVANTGWLPTHVSRRAETDQLVRPIIAELTGADGQAVTVLGGPARQQLGQLAGRAALRFRGGNDGTPDRALASWVVRAAPGTPAAVTVRHDRAGTCRVELTLDRS